MLQSIITILVTVWIVFSLILYFRQERFVYFPQTAILFTPTDIGLDYQTVNLTTADKVTVNGWWIPHAKPQATLLFLHGNGGNISYYLDSIALFHELSLSVLIIDYRGYGNSTGKPTESGTYIDAAAAWDYLTQQQNIAAEEIIILGRSLGGAVAIALATQHTAAGLIIESTFTSMQEIARHYYPYLPIRLIARIQYPSIDRINNIQSPILVIHSPDDEVVPYRFGKALFAAANEPKTFLKLSGDHNHGFIENSQKYSAGLQQFIATVIPIK